MAVVFDFLLGEPLLHKHRFIHLKDVPQSYSGQAGRAVRVKAGEDGLEFYAIGAGGTDELVGVSSGDSSANFLSEKLIGTAGKISFSIVTPGGDEDYQATIGADVFDKTVDDTDDISEGTKKFFFAHDVLSASHGDTLPGAVVRGSLIYGNATPKWAALGIGAAGKYLKSDGTDISWEDVPAGYTDEQAQDAVGTILTDTNSIDATYDDATPKITFDLKYQDGNGIDLSVPDASGLKADIYFASQARGDLILRGALAWGRLAIGTAGKYLKSDGTDASWEDLPAGYAGWISDADAGGPKTLASGETLDIAGGTGISTALAGAGSPYTLTITNTAPNIVQNLFETISCPAGTNPVADTATDTLTLLAGAGITITGDSAADSVTFASTITQYTDEMAQDAIGLILLDGNGINFTYDDATPNITADIYFASQVRGDIITRGATLWQRVAIGTSGKFLKSDGTDPSWQSLASTDMSDFAEAAQDAIGAMIATTNSITLTYADATPALTADLKYQDGNGIDLSVPDASGLKADIYFASQARGDLIVRGATLWGRLALGTSGYFLKAGATDPAWAQMVASDISNFSEAVDDRVAALLVAGTGITLVYDDGANSLTINSVWQKSGTVLSPATAGDTAQIGDGIAGAPGYAFSGDVDTGLYLVNTAVAGISIAGTGRYYFGASTYILGSVSVVSAATIDFAFNGSTPRMRMGIGWYIQLQQTGGLNGVEMIGDLYPLSDLDANANLGDSTRRFLLTHSAQTISELTEVDVTLLPYSAVRTELNPAAHVFDYYSQLNVTIDAGAAANTTLSRGWLYREFNPAVSNLKILTNAYAEFKQSYRAVLATGGVVVDTDHYWESFERAAPEWDIHVVGAHRNRYNGIAPIALGIGVPDSWVVAFTYALPDALYSVNATGHWAAYTVTDAKKLVIGTGWVHVKAVIDPSTKTTAGFTGYLEYQAVDNATKASWAGSQWNNYTVMIGPAGIAAHYLGGVTCVFSDADLVSGIEWALRRYY